MDAEAIGDAVYDENLLLFVRGRGEEVGGVFDGEALGGVGGVGQGRGVPDVVGVGGVEFWGLLVCAFVSLSGETYGEQLRGRRFRGQRWTP